MHSQQPPGVVQNWSTLQCSKHDIEQCGYDHAPVTRGRMRTQFPLPHGPPKCSAFCEGPKVDWCVLDSTPSLRNHLAFSRCVPCLMYNWAAHQRSMGPQLIMKRRLYPGCNPLCPHPHSLPHTVPSFCFYAGGTWFFNCLWKCGMSLPTLFTQMF